MMINYAKPDSPADLKDYFSLAVDESIDISDISQLLIFIRAVDENFTVCKSISTSWSYKRYQHT